MFSEELKLYAFRLVVSEYKSVIIIIIIQLQFLIEHNSISSITTGQHVYI